MRKLFRQQFVLLGGCHLTQSAHRSHGAPARRTDCDANEGEYWLDDGKPHISTIGLNHKIHISE